MPFGFLPGWESFKFIVSCISRPCTLNQPAPFLALSVAHFRAATWPKNFQTRILNFLLLSLFLLLLLLLLFFKLTRKSKLSREGEVNLQREGEMGISVCASLKFNKVIEQTIYIECTSTLYHC